MDWKSVFTFEKDKLVIAYYLALTAFLFYIIRPDTTFPLSVRIVLLGATILPAIFNARFLPAVMVLFYGIESSSFTSVFPDSDFYYISLIVIVFILHNKPNKFLGKELIVLLLFFILALVHSDLKPVLLWVFLALLLGDMVKTKDDLVILAYAFFILTIFLSAQFLVYQEEFAIDYGDSDLGLERSSWINANVFGASISAGGVLATAYLTNVLRVTRSRLGIILSAAAVILASVCLPLNASRGALLSFVLPSLILLIVSRINVMLKLLVVLLLAVFVWMLFQTGTLDLVLYRIEMDDTQTGSRSEIWLSKLAGFLAVDEPFRLLFGIGQTRCVELGEGFAARMSTHNDFLTALIAYGGLGCLAFIFSAFFYPIIRARRDNRLAVIVVLLYLAIECMVLEPIFRGYFVEIMFLVFVINYTALTSTDEDYDEEMEEQV